MATMVEEPYLTHVPTLAGGTGRKEVESFYRDYFVGHWPDDVEVKSLSRTVGNEPGRRRADRQFHPRPGNEDPISRASRRPAARSCCRMSSSWASTTPGGSPTSTSIGIRRRCWRRWASGPNVVAGDRRGTGETAHGSPRARKRADGALIAERSLSQGARGRLSSERARKKQKHLAKTRNCGTLFLS